jgi:4'-phosphopantetheinyl transferase
MLSMRTLTADDFIPSSAPPELAPGEIHLWLFTQDSTADRRTSDHEKSLRELLGAYLQLDAKSLCFERDTHGKPFLVDLPANLKLQFNLSHTGNFLLIGVSREQSLGVDLETLQRQRPWLELARRYFSKPEFSALAALAADQCARAFLDLWSCKEAVLKALGRGIAFGLHRLEFSLGTHGSVGALMRIDHEAGALAGWHVVRLVPGEGMLGALAWHGSMRTLRAFRSNVCAVRNDSGREPAVACDARDG